jgi:transposase
MSHVISQLLERFSIAYEGGSVTLRGMKAYALDLRLKALRVCDQRLGSRRAIAALCGVSQSFVEKLLRRPQTIGDIMPHPHADDRKAILDPCKVVTRVCDRRHREEPTVTLPDCFPQGFSCPKLWCLASRNEDLPSGLWISPFPGGA